MSEIVNSNALYFIKKLVLGLENLYILYLIFVNIQNKTVPPNFQCLEDLVLVVDLSSGRINFRISFHTFFTS